MAQQPDPGYYGAATFEQEMQQWIEWLRVVLQYISCQLPKSCLVLSFPIKVYTLRKYLHK